MREGYHWLFIFAWTSHDSVLQPTGRKADCITGRVSVCFGAELWRRATWKHSSGMLHAFSSSFAQSTGITGSGHQCVLMSACVYVSVCLFMSVCVCVRLGCAYCRYLKRLSQSTFQSNSCLVRTYLAVAKHDNPHQHHVDLCSQRLVMVDLIHLESHGKTQEGTQVSVEEIQHNLIQVVTNSFINCC